MAPRFTVLTPVYKPDAELLRACIGSVQAQTFHDWQLILIDDASGEPAVSEVLRDASASDARITVITREANGGIGAATRDGLAAAQGDFVGFLDHDDRLASHALERVASVIAAEPDADYIYSDEEVRRLDDSVAWRVQKPGWSPELIRCQNYCNHFSVFRREVVERAGGIRTEFDGSQDYDLVLRVSEIARRIIHIPESLYYWYQAPGSVTTGAEAKPWAYKAGVRAINEHLQRIGLAAEAVETSWPGVQRVRRDLSNFSPTVSIVIPTRGAHDTDWGVGRVLAAGAIASIVERTRYANYEIIVLAGSGTPGPARALMMQAGLNRVRIIDVDGEFSFARVCNTGAVRSAGEILLFLNDDTEVENDDWLDEIVGFFMEEDVGVVGAKLLFPDNTIQHAGLCFAGDPQHAHYRISDTQLGEMAALQVSRECAAVTGACLAIRRSLFEEIGGFSPEFPLSYNDVDLCIKARRAGYRVVWTPHARLWHFESRSRDPSVEPVEHDRLYGRWRGEMYADPYFAPNLSGAAPDAIASDLRPPQYR